MKPLLCFGLALITALLIGGTLGVAASAAQAPGLENAICTNRIDDLRIMVGKEIETDYGPLAREEGESVPPHYMELNINQDTLETEFGAAIPLAFPLLLTYGGNGIFNEDYLIGSASFAFGSEVTSNLTVDMGMKGMIGRIEAKRVKGDLGAVGLFASAVYDNRSPTGIPFEFSAMIGTAPSVLNFMDADELLTLKLSFGLHVFTQKRGTVLIGFRYLKISIEDNAGKLSDSAPFAGIRFRF